MIEATTLIINAGMVITTAGGSLLGYAWWTGRRSGQIETKMAHIETRQGENSARFDEAFKLVHNRIDRSNEVITSVKTAVGKVDRAVVELDSYLRGAADTEAKRKRR